MLCTQSLSDSRPGDRVRFDLKNGRTSTVPKA